MKIKKVTIELMYVNSLDRRMKFQVEDEEGRVLDYQEHLWESDAVDVIRTIFRNALRYFHDRYDKEKGRERI
jgi:hypothetical protein